VGERPTSVREALLNELCAHGGYCSTGLTADDLTGDLSADEITELVLRREGFLEEGRDVVMASRTAWDEVARMVRDWLFDPRGRGARSGLPR
jgi:hypothetical protein